MSMSLPRDIIQEALDEHDFHGGEYCARCGLGKTLVLTRWRHGLADTVRCKETKK